jgi:hypothetical protein
VRTKTIILGALAALALATVSVNAGNAPHRSLPGSAMSLVAGTAAIAKAERDEANAAVRTTSAVKKTSTTTTPSTSTAAAQKSEVENEAGDDAPKGPVSQACQTAIDNLKALRQADTAEDTAEKATPGTADADKAEDMTEADNLKAARLAVRTACLPQPSAACKTALDNLKALRQADVTEDTAEKANPGTTDADKAEDKTEAQKLSDAGKAVRTACGERD